MKKITFLIAISLSILSNAKGIKINGTLTNSTESSVIYLYQTLGTEAEKIDSSEVKKGIFSFKGPLERGFYRIGFNPQNNIIIILGNEELSVEGDAKNLTQTAKIINSKENTLFTEFMMFNNSYSSDIQNLQLSVNQARSMQNTNPTSAQAMFQKIQSDYDSILKTRVTFYENIINTNKETYVAKIAQFYLKSDNLKQEEFYAQQDLNDTELQKGDMFVALTSTYIQKFLNTPGADINTEAINLINKQKEETNARELLYIAFIRNLLSINPQNAAQLGKLYKKDFPNSNYQKGLTKGLPALPLGIGDEAPEIEEKNPNGEIMRLSDTRGKVVLLDFWASWCGPCRRENPNVVMAYNKYKDKGFTVFSVSLDSSKPKWEDAIKRDGLAWDTHVSDLKGWSAEPAKLYNVRGIPATFLLDQNGVIIGQNLRGAALEQKLEELLK